MALSTAAQSAEESVEDPVPPLEPAVTRSFGQLSEPVERRIQHTADFNAGQMAYYFREYNRALQLWTPLAEENNPDAQANLGWMYQMGLGVQSDLAQAAHWYELAIKAGHAVAQNNLGVMYEKGLYLTQNLEKATELYRLSARSGYRFGQHNYARQLDRLQQPDKANQWYIEAARQGVAEAIDILQSRGIKDWKPE